MPTESIATDPHRQPKPGADSYWRAGVACAWLTASALALSAQTPKAGRFTGEWSGTFVTDALRGSVSHAITGQVPRLSIATTVAARERTLHGVADSIQVRGDTLRFGVTIDGARLRWVASLKNGALRGSISVWQGNELTTTGVWETLRAQAGSTSAPSGVVTARSVFDALWTSIDRGYGNFASKRIDWTATRNLFSARIDQASNDSALFHTLSELLGLLNDVHVGLRSDSMHFSSGHRAPLAAGDLSLQTISRRYATSELHSSQSGAIDYGWLTDSVGYLHLAEFGQTRAFAAVFDSVFEQFRAARGLIIDIRDNRGGNDVTGQRLLNRLADTRRLYMVTRARALSAHDSFLPPRNFYLEPGNDTPFRGPVVVLTNRRTVSAGENFLLGVRALPNTSIVGDVTAGAFSDVTRETLPNGWILSYPMNQVLDSKGRSWEGIGLPPDYWRVTGPEEVRLGRDGTLEFGLALIATQRVK